MPTPPLGVDASYVLGIRHYRQSTEHFLHLGMLRPPACHNLLASIAMPHERGQPLAKPGSDLDCGKCRISENNVLWLEPVVNAIGKQL